MKNRVSLLIFRSVIFGSFLIASLFFYADFSRAAGNVSSCKVMVKAVFLKSVSGEWVPVKGAEHEANLSFEEPVLSFVNYDRIRPGKYVNFKIVLSETLKVAGRDGRNFTREGGEIRVGGTAVKVSDLPGEITSLQTLFPTWNIEKEGEIIEHLNLDYEDRNDTMEIYPARDFQKPFIVKKSSAVHIWIMMNLDRTAYFAFPNSIRKGVPKENVMYFIPPNMINEVSITVDAASHYASDEGVTFDF